MRFLEIITGLVVIFAAGVVLLDPGLGILVLIFLLAVGLLLGGVARLAVGAYGSLFSPSLRAANAGAGLVMIVLGIVSLVDTSLAAGVLIILLAFALLVTGVMEIMVGAFAQHPPKWLRSLVGAVGVLTIIFSVLVLLDPALGQFVLAAILAVTLLVIGIRDLTSGITGHHHRAHRGVTSPLVSV